MTSWDVLAPYLPSAWLAALGRLPPQEQDSIQELRLRADEPLVLSFPDGDRYLCTTSSSALQQPNALVCRAEQLQECFLRFCEDSLYAHEAELRQGFLSVRGGIRVGLAGTAVLDGDSVRTIRRVTSLCVRLPRRHAGCAASLMPHLCRENGVVSTLLVGEPSSGKTSLLRDVAATLAARRVRVAVVDERGELVGEDALVGCDVLRGYPKAVGILQAVRCLAPQVVVFDELGDEAEIAAVSACAHAGVAVVASLHGRTPEGLACKRVVRELVRCEVFAQWVFLRGRCAPGEWRACVCPEVIEDEIYWRAADGGGGARAWDSVCAPIACAGVLP